MRPIREAELCGLVYRVKGTGAAEAAPHSPPKLGLPCWRTLPIRRA